MRVPEPECSGQWGNRRSRFESGTLPLNTMSERVHRWDIRLDGHPCGGNGRHLFVYLRPHCECGMFAAAAIERLPYAVVADELIEDDGARAYFRTVVRVHLERESAPRTVYDNDVAHLKRVVRSAVRAHALGHHGTTTPNIAGECGRLLDDPACASSTLRGGAADIELPAFTPFWHMEPVPRWPGAREGDVLAE